MRRVREILHYRFNRLLGRGSAVQYAVLVLCATLVVLLGINAWFVGLFSTEALEAEGIDNAIDGGVLDAAWWSLKHVMDPGAFAENYGAPWPVLFISFLLSITGLALLGVLIAFITSSVQQRVEGLRKGNTPVIEQGHTLLLGWSRKVVPILQFIANSDRREAVVLFAQRDIDAMEESLGSRPKQWAGLDLVLRSGSASSLSELERVGLKSASRVISLAQEPGPDDADTDIETIKTLMLLRGYDGWSGPRPRMVAEIGQKRNVPVANIAAAGSVPLVSASEIISKAITQAARQPGVSRVYTEIFSDTGNSIYVRSVPEAVGKTFGELAHWFPEAVPIGVSWPDGKSGRTAAALNPGADYDIAEDDSLIFVARRADFRLTPDAPPAGREFGGDGRKHAPQLRRLLILGWNENLDEILSEMDTHASGDAVATVVANHTPEAAETMLAESLPGGLSNLRIDYRRGNPVNRQQLEALDVASYDALVILADESHGRQDPDARTIISLLLLTDMGRNSAMPPVVVELYEAANRPLLRDTVAGDVLVSPELVSLQLAHISRQPVLDAIFRELLSAGGIECRLQPAARYVGAGRTVRFGEIVTACQQFSEIALGVQSDGIRLNPGRDTALELGAADHVVVIAQQRYE